MNDPTRYRVANNQAQLTLGGGILAVDPAGPLIMYDDYARLKAEVERLRKAGDEMATLFGGDYSDNDGVCYDRKWNAAKEGKV
jgi:hypothetical protein